MADPIKTTVQQALDHIKEWISKGEKDKAVKGLQEILSFDPMNDEAKKMLSGLQGTPAPAVGTGSASLDMELKPVQPSAPQAPAAPVAPPVPVAQPPAPTITTPEVPPAPVTSPAPTITPPPPPAPTPATLKPVTAPPAPTPAPTSMTASQVEQAQPEMLSKVQTLSKHIRWIIFVGVLISAVIGGYFFYKTFLSGATALTGEIQQLAGENSSEGFSTTEDTATTTPNSVSDVLTSTEETSTNTSSDTSSDTPSADNPSTDEPSTPDTAVSSDTTVKIENSTSTTTNIPSEGPGEKVKRR